MSIHRFLHRLVPLVVICFTTGASAQWTPRPATYGIASTLEPGHGLALRITTGDSPHLMPLPHQLPDLVVGADPKLHLHDGAQVTHEARAEHQPLVEPVVEPADVEVRIEVTFVIRAARHPRNRRSLSHAAELERCDPPRAPCRALGRALPVPSWRPRRAAPCRSSADRASSACAESPCSQTSIL